MHVPSFGAMSRHSFLPCHVMATSLQAARCLRRRVHKDAFAKRQEQKQLRLSSVRKHLSRPSASPLRLTFLCGVRLMWRLDISAPADLSRFKGHLYGQVLCIALLLVLQVARLTRKGSGIWQPQLSCKATKDLVPHGRRFPSHPMASPILMALRRHLDQGHGHGFSSSSPHDFIRSD